MKKSKFWQDAVQSVVNPKQYFSNLSADETYGASILKVIYYGLIGGLFIVAISIAETDITEGFGFIAIFMGMGLSLLGILNNILVLFAGGLIISIITAICGGKTNYKFTIQVTASLEVLMIPLIFFAMFSNDITLKYYFNTAISLYAVWMLYDALIYAFHSRRLPVILISVILALISVIPIINHPHIF